MKSLNQKISYKKYARVLINIRIWGFLILSLILFACKPGSVPPQATSAAQNTPAVTATAQPTDTPSPSPTPQPSVILLAPDGADAQQKEALQSLLTELANGSGLDLKTSASLSPADLTSAVRAVVVLPPDPGLAALAEAAPKTQFLAVGIPGIESGKNIAVVKPQGAPPDQQGFLAGYLASLVTPDWRIAVLSAGDTPDGLAQRQGFLNGATFYCGLCRPAYPPFVQYPLYADIASGASAADQQAAADNLIAQSVATVYVAPGTGDAALLEYLAGKGVNLIGSEPPPEALKDHWIATISSDWQESVRLAWDSLINKQNSASQGTPLTISDRNEALFSVGRQRLAEQVSAELASGLIDTGVNPATGEVR